MNDMTLINIVEALQRQDWYEISDMENSHGLYTIKAEHELNCTGNHYDLTMTFNNNDDTYEALQKSIVDSISDDYNENADRYTKEEADEILSLITDLEDRISRDFKWYEWTHDIEQGLNDTDITMDDILMKYDELRHEVVTYKKDHNIFSYAIRPEGALKSNIPWEVEESDFSITPFVHWNLENDKVEFLITVVYGTRDYEKTFGKPIAEEQKEAIKTLFREAVQHYYGVTMEQFLEDNAD